MPCSSLALGVASVDEHYPVTAGHGLRIDGLLEIVLRLVGPELADVLIGFQRQIRSPLPAFSMRRMNMLPTTLR
jgi:hypothetical protein